MSNRRRSGPGNNYRTGFLKSSAWFARRDRWFQDETGRAGRLRCIVCTTTADRRDLELHHLDYTGVQQTTTGWIAAEQHDDLVPAHPRCHELLHRLLDRDRVLRSLRGRRTANTRAIRQLRRKFASSRTGQSA